MVSQAVVPMPMGRWAHSTLIPQQHHCYSPDTVWRRPDFPGNGLALSRVLPTAIIAIAAAGMLRHALV